MKTLSLALFTVTGTSSLAGTALAEVKCGLDGQIISGYDDNITYVNTNPISDMVTRTSIFGDLIQSSKNHVLDLKGGLTENIYTDHSSLDNLAENLKADYTADLNPYEHIKAVDTFTHSVDPSLENSFGRINGNYGTYYNNLDLESVTNITEKLSTTVKYMQSNYIFSTKALSDSTGYDPELSAEYDFSSQSQASVNYDYRLRVFNPGSSSYANTPTAGWRQYLNAQWYVDLLAGADFIEGFGQSLAEPRYGAGLTHDLDKNTNLTLRFDKKYEVDPFTQDVSNNWQLTLNGFHELTPRLTIDLPVFYGTGKYVISGTSYQFIGTNVTFNYTLNDHISLSLAYGFQDSISQSNIRSSLHNTVFAGADYKF